MAIRKIVIDKPSDNIVGLNDIDMSKSIIAGVTNAPNNKRIVIVHRASFLRYPQGDNLQASLITAEDLWQGNSFGPEYHKNTHNIRTLVYNSCITLYAFDTPKEFFQWAAEQL